jgi:hypothetical protein
VSDELGGIAAQDSYDPFAAETFLPPPLKDWTAQAAPKDVGVIQGAMGSLADLGTLPQRAIQNSQMAVDTGTYDPRVPVEAATTLAGGALPWAEKGAAGVFGGRLAQTADLGALARAEEMAAKGHAPAEITDATGWFKGADNKWRFEIPDQPSQWKDTPDQFTNLSPQGTRMHGGDPVALGTVFDHPDLFKAYPQLANVEFKPSWLGSSMRGQYVPGHPEFGIDPSITITPMGPGAMRSTMVHELQHGIQDIEGFGRGGNTFGLKPNTPAWDLYQERLAAIKTPTPKADLEKSGVLGPEYTYDDYLREHQQSLRGDKLGLDRAAQEYAVGAAYHRSAGEVEARNVQTRLKYTPEELKSITPGLSQDVPYKQQFVTFRNPGEIGDVAESRAPIQGIRAYHSSPHDFEKFDLSKIGTGEGAQVYGHGIYAAENPAVSGQGGTYYNQFMKRFSGPESSAAIYLQAAGFDRQRAAQIMRDSIAKDEAHTATLGVTGEDLANFNAYNTQRKEALARLESGAPVGPRTYELNIKADPAQMLDWDKPLGQQSDYVREALTPQRLGLKAAGPLGDKGWYGWTDAQNRLVGRAQTKDVPAEIFDPREMAQSVYRGVGTWKPPEASNILNQAGIPGIKYLDEGSRGVPQEIARYRKQLEMPNWPDDTRALIQKNLAAWEAKPITSNYVVFDPANIDILKKYGIAAAPVGMGALAAQDQYSNQQ